MHPNPRRIAPIVVLALLVIGGLWWQRRVATATSGTITASGTIEATRFVIAPELSGRIAEVPVQEGDRVTPAQLLVALDSTLLQAQRNQARAALVAAQAAAKAAGLTAKLQRSMVDSTLERTQAAEAQAAAATAQVDAAQAAVQALDIQIAKMHLIAPVNGTVIDRAIEPGEMALPGTPLLTVADLDHLKITVYVPEDRYGAFALGQAATVNVDSWPGESFTATVDHIVDEAEFTPRNVQTTEGRKTTVFAIRLKIDNPEGKLKPGSPADITFGE